jgi:multimeric flavodoxin WrbA
MENEMQQNKKILVIMGSPRKGNTFRACEELRGFLEKELAVEFEYLWLKDANLQPCRGCLACFAQGEERARTATMPRVSNRRYMMPMP